MRAFWNRLPVVLRALLMGLVAASAGTLPWAGLVALNLKHGSRVPWAVPPTALYLWLLALRARRRLAALGGRGAARELSRQPSLGRRLGNGDSRRCSRPGHRRLDSGCHEPACDVAPTTRPRSVTVSARNRGVAAYDSPRQAGVPSDLQAALNRNATAKAFFATLNRLNRYAILHRIQTAKKAETRAKRIEKFVGMLAKHETLYP